MAVPREEPWPGDDATAVEKKLTTKDADGRSRGARRESVQGPLQRRKNPTGLERFSKALAFCGTLASSPMRRRGIHTYFGS
jgi:hypothetical protein